MSAAGTLTARIVNLYGDQREPRTGAYAENTRTTKHQARSAPGLRPGLRRATKKPALSRVRCLTHVMYVMMLLFFALLLCSWTRGELL